MNLLIFDIETIPDVNAGRQLHDVHDLNDEEVVDALLTLRRQHTQGSDFLPHYLHQIVAISLVLRTNQAVKVWSLGSEDSNEKELIERFFMGLERYQPTLVSWNGSGFDLPVLHYRALLHGVSASRYWDSGEIDTNFRWNNYLNRYHARHTDLMDVLSAYQSRAYAPLDAIATLLGFPGKMGMSGSKVWEQYHKGELRTIRDYCETDVLNTYLVYLRFELMRGNLTPVQYDEACKQLRDMLDASGEAHLLAFLDAWKNP